MNWIPTCELRYVSVYRGWMIQQKWVDEDGNFEWRPIKKA